MEASYTWHPGAHCLIPRWPLTPQLLPDELFSSWLVRTALLHGCTPRTLTNHAWPGSRIWSIDIDRTCDETRLANLAHLTGISVERLIASTLLPVSRSLHPQPFLRTSSLWPWIMVLGCRHQVHAGGLQCCPECMAGSTPHYSVHDRFAWHTCCPLHRILLVDRCPHCSSALQPGLLDQSGSIFKCHHCEARLNSAASFPCSKDALAFQAFADGLYGQSTMFGGDRLSFADWMFVARVIIGLLLGVARHPTSSTRLFCELMQVDAAACQPSSLGLPLEYLSPAERSALMGQTWVIMQAGPERFVECALRAVLPCSALPLPAREAPQVLNQMASALSCSSRCPRHKKEQNHIRRPLGVLRMWLRLQRRIRRDGLH
ncbi:TniQ family protein [Pseudomonas soli]|uniref:TniQ family protein n=1 Tax=Pseudomonas soli TaxID=1306993 RepID=UPI0035E418AF